MSGDLLDLMRKYSGKNSSRMKAICAPLATHLGIPNFLYYSVDAAGLGGILTNDVDYNEFYYSHKMQSSCSNFSHPTLFRSGYAFILPCSSEKNQKLASEKYGIGHEFLMLEVSDKKMEGFVFYQKHMSEKDMPRYVGNLDLLIKYSQYFKREAGHLIDQMEAEQFSMQSERKEKFLKVESLFPLLKNTAEVQGFLWDIYGLSPQETRCLELFKQGCPAQMTASIMGLSRRTIETYFDRIKEKLNCASKWELLNY